MAVSHVPTVPLKVSGLYHFLFLGAVAPLPSGDLTLVGPQETRHIALSLDEEDVYVFRPEHLAIAFYSKNGFHVCPQDSLLRQPTTVVSHAEIWKNLKFLLLYPNLNGKDISFEDSQPKFQTNWLIGF